MLSGYKIEKSAAISLVIIILPIINFIQCDWNTYVENYEPEYTPEISVFAMISPSPQYEFVVVERTMRLGESQDYINDIDSNEVPTIIKDAVVTIFGQKDTVEFKFYRAAERYPGLSWNDDFYYRGLYLDRKHKFQAEPGQTYQLQVKVPDGRIVRGQARVPEKPVITRPSGLINVPARRLAGTRIEWTTSPNTAAYEFNYLGSYHLQEKDPLLFNIHLVQKILIQPPEIIGEIDGPNFYSSQDFMSDTTLIKIMAMDANYYDYIRTNNGISEFTGSSIKLVEGGTGVFGAVNFDSVRIVVTEK